MIAPFTIFPSTAKEREEINHLIVHAVRSRSRQCSHSFASQSFHQSIIAFTVHMPGLLSCTQRRTLQTISSLKAWCKNIAGSFNVFFREYVFFLLALSKHLLPKSSITYNLGIRLTAATLSTITIHAAPTLPR